VMMLGCNKADVVTASPTQASAEVAASSDAKPSEPRKLVIGNSRIHELHSPLTGKDYELIVGLPKSYESEPGRRFPVLYLLDGQWDFTLVNSLVGGLLYDQVIEEFILVGVSYGGEKPDYERLRAHDYTPTPGPNGAGGAGSIAENGGGPDFLRFLEIEAFPLVETTYRVDPSFRMLSGSSHGGLFTLYAMFEKPELFQAYLALSPNVPWDERYLFRREREFRASDRSLAGKRLWLSVGSEEWPDYTQANLAFFEQVRASAYPGLALHTLAIEGEHHAGVKPEAYNRALRFAFEK